MTQQPNDGKSDNRLLELIGALLNHAATPEQQAELGDQLASDAEARHTFRRYVNLHVALRTYAVAATDSLCIAELEADAGALPVCVGCPKPPAWRRRAPLVYALLATTAVVLAWASLLVFRSQSGDLPSQAHAPCLATITKTASARFSSGDKQLAQNSQLFAGPIDLVEGLAELTFASGVKVVLEAPVELDLLGATSAKLSRGRVVAKVPPAGRGFSIETPRARVVDWGTEFGVGVAGSGETEVQVFQGVVVAEWKGAEGKTIEDRIEAGSAVSINAESPKGIPFEPERFRRMFPADLDCGELSGPLYNRSRFDTLHVVPAAEPPTIDGDLSDWDRSGAFYSACLPPYHESHYVEGAMMADEKFVYIGAHVGDPAPMRSVMDPVADAQQYPWRGGSVIVRLVTDGSLGWPLDAIGPAEGDVLGRADAGRRPQDTSQQIVHLTMWYHQPSGKPRLHLSYGMDFHGERTDPEGWQGAFRIDPNACGYTLEYAIPWSLLNTASRPPTTGAPLAANWTVHWSDHAGELSRGHLVEITNLDNRPFRFLRASTWGKAIYHDRGNLPPGTVAPKTTPDTSP